MVTKMKEVGASSEAKETAEYLSGIPLWKGCVGGNRSLLTHLAKSGKKVSELRADYPATSCRNRRSSLLPISTPMPYCKDKGSLQRRGGNRYRRCEDRFSLINGCTCASRIPNRLSGSIRRQNPLAAEAAGKEMIEYIENSNKREIVIDFIDYRILRQPMF